MIGPDVPWSIRRRAAPRKPANLHRPRRITCVSQQQFRTSQKDRRKYRKYRKPRQRSVRDFLGNDINKLESHGSLSGVWRKPDRNRRKLAETPCRNSARETVSSFAVSATGCTPSRDWHIASGNCGNSLQILCQASPLRLSASAANGDTSRVYLMRIQRFRTSLQPCRDRRIRRAPACPAGNSAGPSTSRW